MTSVTDIHCPMCGKNAVDAVNVGRTTVFKCECGYNFSVSKWEPLKEKDGSEPNKWYCAGTMHFE